MYSLIVYLPGQTTGHYQVTIERASEVLTVIPQLLKDHQGCERIEVRTGNTHLFSVDCSGNTIA